MEPPDTEGQRANRGLCDLKARGFADIAGRLLDRLAPRPDALGNRTCTSNPYRIEKRSGTLTVYVGEEILLQVEGELPRINRLAPEDLFRAMRLEAKLARDTASPIV
jgi:hypothetical protein